MNNLHIVIGCDLESQNPTVLHVGTDAEAGKKAYRDAQAAAQYPRVSYFRKPSPFNRTLTGAKTMPKRRGRPAGSGQKNETDKPETGSNAGGTDEVIETPLGTFPKTPPVVTPPDEAAAVGSLIG